MKRLYRLLAALAFSVLSIAIPLARGALAGAIPSPPSCRADHLNLTLGLTKEVWTNKSDRWIGWVMYMNTGALCRMDKSDVGVQAIAGPRHVPIGQPSVGDAVARLPFVMSHGSSARGLVELLLTLPAVPYSCVPTVIDQIEIYGYQFGWPNHYFSISRWTELAVCNGDDLVAVGGVLTPIAHSPSTPVSPASQSTPECSDLVVGVTGGGAASGNSATSLLFANAGRRCQISGYPRIAAFRTGSLVALTYLHRGSYIYAEPAPRTIVLAHDSVASVGLTQLDYLGNGQRDTNRLCPPIDWIAVSLPNGVAIGQVAFEGAPCGRELYVTPFEAGPKPANA